jgi:hypothetical protein
MKRTLGGRIVCLDWLGQGRSAIERPNGAPLPLALVSGASLFCKYLLLQGLSPNDLLCALCSQKILNSAERDQ